MKRYIQNDPFNIYCFDAALWEHPVHKHNHFEIIFIKSGSGKHFVNNNEFAFGAGDVFLLGPEDFHYFELDTPTNFVFIRFMEVFFKEEHNHFSNWQDTLTFLLYAPYQSYGSIVKDAREKVLLNHLIEVLISEYNLKHSSTYTLMMDSVMKGLLTVLVRNIIQQSPDISRNEKSSQPIENLIRYIRQNIMKPDNLRIERLAEQHHYSAHYLSIYFKKHVGIAIQQYILQYKLKLIENRLKYGNSSISQIAYDFGFTDESHLNKIFKKYYNVPPGIFRTNQMVNKNHYNRI